MGYEQGIARFGLLTRAEVADRFAVSESWVKDRTRSGDLAYLKFGHLVLIDPADFDAMLQRMRVAAKAERPVT